MADLPGKWQDCDAFVCWLVAMKYLDEKKRPCMSGGIYLYMWEAWTASGTVTWAEND